MNRVISGGRVKVRYFGGILWRSTNSGIPQVTNLVEIPFIVDWEFTYNYEINYECFVRLGLNRIYKGKCLLFIVSRSPNYKLI